NVKGTQIASSVDQLHGTNQLTKETALTERGDTVMGRGDAVNMHDMLTGSTPDGRATVGSADDTTCGNWTKAGDGSANVGQPERPRCLYGEFDVRAAQGQGDGRRKQRMGATQPAEPGGAENQHRGTARAVDLLPGGRARRIAGFHDPLVSAPGGTLRRSGRP